MAFTGYFVVQDAIVFILSASLGYSLVRRGPGDPTRWVPRNGLMAARWLAGFLVLAVSLITAGRHPTPPYYVLSFAGSMLFLAGAVFFYGAKSPMSSILYEDERTGVSLRPGGFYRFVRHPVFFGLLLCSFGFPLYLVSLPGLIAAAAVALPLLLHSSRALDAYWAGRAGEAYEQYRKAVHLLLPSTSSVWPKG